MKKDDIVQVGDPVLRKITKEINISEITSKKTKLVLEKMQKLLSKENDGVALAAPQIGKSLRIFIISPKAYKIAKKNLGELVFINPKIIKTGKEQKAVEEGCLSVRGKFGKIKRYNKLTVEAYDENGSRFERGFSGFLAQIIQHEINHLDGILFIDKTHKIEDITKAGINEL